MYETMCYVFHNYYCNSSNTKAALCTCIYIDLNYFRFKIAICIAIYRGLCFAMSVAVKAIKRQHLVEIRSMANPPAVVKLALESICLLLEESATDWKQIRAVIMKDSFIPTIVNFNTENIT